MIRDLMRPVCAYISDVLASDAPPSEKHIARTIMHLLPLDAALAAPVAPYEQSHAVSYMEGMVPPTEDEAQVEFETWVSSLPSADEINLRRAKFGRFREYVDRTTECMFDTWKAARTHGIKP